MYRLLKGDTMRYHSQGVNSAICFGLGLLTATLLPTDWVLIVAAGALVAVSISCVRR
ncbi:MAG: hypothetical protein LUF33_05860 [Clostridiales bacterium]|nr:hypothetical protein [Clostridiales bacterium]